MSEQYQFPPLNQCPDYYRQVQATRLAMQKEVEKVEVLEKAIKRYMIDNIPKDSVGVFGLQFKAQVVVKPTIRVSEGGWPALLNWVRHTGRFDILQKRINPAPLLELWNGDPQTAPLNIPGTERANDIDLSVTKV